MAPITAPTPDPKAFDNFFGRMALEHSPFTEAHDVGVMTSLMAIYSAAIGNGPRIATRGKAMPLSFWPILCGLSGKGRKGTATGAALEIAARGLADFTDNNIQYGFDSGLGVIQELDSRKNQETGKPEPILIYEEEMSKFVEAGKKDRRLGSTMTKLWDGSSIQYKTGRDHITVSHPHAAFIGHVQPKLWSGTRNSKDAAGGTWNRFLIFWVERSKIVDIFADMPGYEATIARMGRDLRRAVTHGREVSRVRVPEHVAKVFAKIHRPTVENLTNQSEEISEFAERALAYLLRIAALYALADGHDTISRSHFDSALALIQYSIASLVYILSNNRQFSGRSTLAQRILAVVNQHGPLSYTKMTVYVGRGYDRETYENALMELEGEVVLYTLPPSGKAGRPAKYVATPKQLPKDAIILDDYSDDIDDDTPEDMPNFRVKVDEEVIDVEVVVNDPEKPATPLKELPAPKAAKTTPKPSQATTEPPKPAGTKLINGRVRPARPETEETATAASSTTPSKPRRGNRWF